MASIAERLDPVCVEAVGEHAAEDQKTQQGETVTCELIKLRRQSKPKLRLPALFNKVRKQTNKKNRSEAHHRPWQVDTAAQDSADPLNLPW